MTFLKSCKSKLFFNKPLFIFKDFQIQNNLNVVCSEQAWVCSGEGSNIIIPIALAAPHILTMTMSFTLWTLKELGALCPAAADHVLF